MKKLITNNVITITFEFATFPPEQVAASQDVNITHKPGIALKDRYSEEQLEEYREFVLNIVNAIKGHQFEITRSQQSKRSYAYYIDFYPVTAEGVKLDKVKIIFRIADHKINDGTGEDIDFKPHSRVYMKNFHIDTTKYPDQFSVVMAVNDICDGLAEGDYSVL